MSKTISDVSVTKQGENRWSVDCYHDGARFHYWSDSVELRPVENVLYKNPPRGIEYKGPGWFQTRRLRIKSTNWLVAAMRDYALANNLTAPAERAAAAAETKRVEDAKTRSIDHALEIVRDLAHISRTPIPDSISDEKLLAELRQLFRKLMDAGESKSVECPHCHFGFFPSVIDQHIREKHS